MSARGGRAGGRARAPARPPTRRVPTRRVPARRVPARHRGITATAPYRWRAKYGGMQTSDVRRLRQLEDENARLKKLVADLSLDVAMLKDVAGRKW